MDSDGGTGYIILNKRPLYGNGINGLSGYQKPLSVTGFC